MALFTVRQLASAEQVKAVFTARMATLNRKPGALDYVGYFAADEKGYFAGELDGKVISGISVVKHSKDFAFIGQYFVDEPYRKKGYGLATWKFATSSVLDDCNCALDTPAVLLPIYSRSGFKQEMKVCRMVFNTCQASLSPFDMNKDRIKPAFEVPFHSILEYDTSVNVFPRSHFLEKWMSAPNCLSYVAVDQARNVVGYTVVRLALRKEDGWIVGPLYADTSKIARSLYQALIEGVAVRNPKGSVVIDIPNGAGCHPESLELAAELNAQLEIELLRMYTKGVPSGLALSKMFGITALGIG